MKYLFHHNTSFHFQSVDINGTRMDFKFRVVNMQQLKLMKLMAINSYFETAHFQNVVASIWISFSNFK